MSRIAALFALFLLAAPTAQASRVVHPPAGDLAPTPSAKAALKRAQGVETTLDLGGSMLVPVSVHSTADGGHIVRFAQTVRGVPVLDAVVTVRLDAEFNVLRTQSSAVEGIEWPAVDPALTGAQALDVARAVARSVLPPEPIGVGHLVRTRRGQLAWLVQVTLAVPTGAPVVVVDALTGEVLGQWNRAKHALRANVFGTGAQAKAARQADGTFAANATTEVTLAPLEWEGENATLLSDAIMGLNCCPNKDCDGTSPPPFVEGKMPISGFDVPFQIAMCDELQLARADEHGSFSYSPAQEPSSSQSPVPGPSEEADAFAEVNAFHHVSAALEYVRSLKPDFKLPKGANPLRVTANFLIPDFNEVMTRDISQIFQEIQNGGSVKIETLQRFDNAMYLPKASGQQLGSVIPGYSREFDSLIFFQGTTHDFAYDPAVVVHEFGHAVVGATAELMDYSADEQGIIDAPGAMNEGYADYWAGAYSGGPLVGQYVGDLSGAGEAALRSLENETSCPTVIWGEVHQDSQHFSAALWAGRKSVAGDDAEKRSRYDRAVLTAMYALTPTSSFEDAADATALEIESAFDANAKALLLDAFASRRVTGCERVLDLPAPKLSRPVFLAPLDGGRGWTPFAPGPLQFRIEVPKGATRLAISVEGQGGDQGGMGMPGMGGGGGQNTPAPLALLKADAPVVFSYKREVSHDATASQGLDDTALFDVDGGCEGQTVFLALGNRAESQYQVSSISLSFSLHEPTLEACDAQPEPSPAPAPPETEDAVADGCGCTSGGDLALALLGLVALVRRGRVA